MLFKSIERDAELLVCSAFLAPTGENPLNGDEAPILVNYMHVGGHYDWGQQINPDQWKSTFAELICRLSKRHRLVLLCHNDDELRLAERLFPDLLRCCPRTLPEYFDFVSKAKGAICNRLHACVALAGLGIPSVAVGTDTRLLMVKFLGLPCYYVKEAAPAQIEESIELLLNGRRNEHERLFELKRTTFLRYAALLRQTLFN
jgi:hypothetical protein